MNSLRVRVAAVLLASIALVVCLATTAAVMVGRYSGRESFIRPIVGEVNFFSTLSETAGALSGLMRSRPAGGDAPAEENERLTELLRASRNTRTVILSRPEAGAPFFISIETGPQRWIVFPISSGGPPPDTWLVLSGWMLLILLGTGAVSLAVSHRIIRPLALLETFAAGVGPRGELAPVPETGPAEVRATARALNRLSQNLRQAVESRMRLVAAAGHDLRTPLTRMRLRAEFLDDEERNKWLGNIDELERIADSAILLVREEVGHADGEVIRLDTMVADIVRDLAAMNLPVRIKTTEPVRIKAPPIALTRALRNLLVNAATHGCGADVAITASGHEALLTIDDCGPGIPDDLIGRVFEPFFRVDQSRRQTIPGAGLGLAIAREIITRADGRLALQNRQGGGLHQYVSFQKADEAA